MSCNEIYFITEWDAPEYIKIKAPVWLWARCNRSSWGYEGTEGYTNRQLKHLLQASGDPRLIIICLSFCVESGPESLGACTSQFVHSSTEVPSFPHHSTAQTSVCPTVQQIKRSLMATYGISTRNTGIWGVKSSREILTQVIITAWQLQAESYNTTTCSMRNRLHFNWAAVLYF